MIHVEPISYSNNLRIEIANSTFHESIEVCFLKVARGHIILPNITATVTVKNIIVSNNDQHYYGNDLILGTNVELYFSNIVFAYNNYKYKSIIKLHSFVMLFHLSNMFISNKARYIIKAQSESPFFIRNFATVSIVDNIAYKVILQKNSTDNFGVPICPIQVCDDKSSNRLDDIDSVDCTFMLLNNTEMISKLLPGQFLPFIDTNLYMV